MDFCSEVDGWVEAVIWVGLDGAKIKPQQKLWREVPFPRTKHFRRGDNRGTMPYWWQRHFLGNTWLKGGKKLSRPLKVGQELLETAKWLFAWSLRKGRIGRTNGSSIPWISEWACERTTTPIRHISQKEVNTNLKGLREWKSDKYSGGNKQKQKEQQRDANDLFNRKDWREKLHWKRWKNWQYLFFFFRIFVIVCLYNSIYKPFTCFSYFHHQTFFSNLDTGHDLSHVPSWAR